MQIGRDGAQAMLTMSRAEAERLLKLMRLDRCCNWCVAPVCHDDCPMRELDMMVARLPESKG